MEDGQLGLVKVAEFSADVSEFSASGQLESDKVAEFSADVSEFSASGQLESDKVAEFSDVFAKFSDAGNSKIGELDAGNSKRRTRYLPISYVYMSVFIILA